MALIQVYFPSCKKKKKKSVSSFISEVWGGKLTDEKKGLEFIAKFSATKLDSFIYVEGLVSSMPQ